MEEVISHSREDTNKHLVELKLKKVMQNMRAQHRKQWESIRIFQIETKEIKNMNESMGSRSDQHKDRV